jgi:hypothetical protein
MTILLDLSAVKNKANFGGWPSPAACPSWSQGRNVPERENGGSPWCRGSPNRAKQSQFAADGIHFNIFSAQELCEIALETRREKQSQFRGWPSLTGGVHGNTMLVAKPVFNVWRFSIFCRKRVRECTI